MEIHPTAIVDPKAELADDVIIHAYSIVGPNVKIGPGSSVGPHAVIDGWTTIGARNRISPFVAIGHPPQDVSYRNEETHVDIGDDNIFREHVTVHRGTGRGRGTTRVGNNNFLMSASHIAHDCQIGNNVVMANVAVLGGHVEIGDFAVVGGVVAIHQYVRIGPHCFIGGGSAINMDAPPYMLVAGSRPAKLFGPNLIGLKRHGFSPGTIQALKKSYRILFRSGLNLREAVDKIRQEVDAVAEVENLLKFMESSKRGVTR
jgi:UDP-N-acetylglucosamine acyltransferase